MELHSVHKTFHHSPLGEEKHQMLNLNQRLETYLSRVKLLEEENALLAKEIHALRRINHGASTRRKGLEEELRQARLEVDAAWRDRVHTELEVGRLTDELQALDLQRQREAQAQVKAKTKLEQSRMELEEEERAQIWLREKVSQLEHEMRHLIQTHQEDVAHMEATLTQSRATVPPTLAQRGNQTPNLLQLGQEYSQWATRAWQEAAEAYQGQLARLEESLNQARSRLTQVGQEKSESQLKLKTLQKEIASAHSVRLHLEKTAAQQGDKYSQEIQQLQAHLEGLEAEKVELGQQIDCLLLENRRLLQLKMSLGLEVATYRALLDSESLRGDNSLLNQPRNIPITDAVFSPQGVKMNYETQLSASHKTTSLSSVRGITGTGPTVITATPIWSRKPVTLTKTTQVSMKHAYEDTSKSATWETPYPKIVPDGAIENFRPQEVHEKVTYAEPLSPPNEEALAETTSEDKEGEEVWNTVGVEPTEERPDAESVVSYQVESGLSTEPPFNDEVIQHQFTTSNLTPHHARMAEEPCGFSDDSDKDLPFEIPAEKEDMQELHAPTDALVERECIGKEEHVQKEISDSETEAVLEPNFESRMSSPMSECEAEESVSNIDVINIFKEDAAEIRQEVSCSTVRTNDTDLEDKLYPDGEEMDTWDSVIERKVDLKTDDGINKDEEKRQHAEPEEDISAREQKHEKREISQDFATDVQQDDNMASPMMDTQIDDDGQRAALDQEHALLPDNAEDDEEEDSQNVSVSWRTELESDSYAQDNTLADTRPLIRYKIDETDANTQAPRMDESESSEGEQQRKIGEPGTGTWSEGKSKRFGTMEDLCEEVEGEALDEEYDLGYTHIDDRGVGHGMTVSEHATLVNETEKTEEMIRKVSEGHSDEETEELIKPMAPTNVDYDELETDRLVEQELENLATESYSAHFVQQQVRESEKILHLRGKSVKEMTEQEEAGKTNMEDIIDQPCENIYFSDLSVEMPQTGTLDDEEVQNKEQEVIDTPEKRMEEVEHSVSMVTHADVTEDHSGFSDFISRPDMEEINNSEEPNSVFQVTADQENLQDVAVPTVEASTVSQKHLIEDVADCQEFPEVPETAEWEVPENLIEDFETRDQNEDYEECAHVPESAESYLHDDGGADEGVVTRKEEPLEISAHSVPDENDIFVVKDSTELLNTNGKDNGLHGFFSSGLKNDLWVSSLETGATYQPDDACNEAAEQTIQNLGFADNLVWGNLENPHVVNINSRVDIDSSKALAIKDEQEQMHLEEKQVLRRNVVEGDLVHSEESEVEGESWSSGEEPV
ncbi:nestin [Siniperca chuatsi]|uniref:nestin n=1 Tax=Siniperca chuatsi TaxID=119488 RepID=UPI001CE1C6D3|nr:nestin [Siniperca chuatsi]XP_044064420.1 nestin [Siniperca chuatsi]